MERLDFRLDEFTRVQWAPGARKVWEPKFLEVSNLWQTIEIELVLAGVKPAALLVVSPEQMPELSRRVSWSKHVPIILGMQGRSTASYASSSSPYIPGQLFDYRVAITSPNLVDHWIDAWENHNDAMIGILLGYPECCRNFFLKYWTEQGHIDTTWHQALGTLGQAEHSNVVDITPDPHCNVTLRAVGIRGVSHLPCSFSCESTKQIGSESAKVIKSLFPEVHKTMSAVLNWPVKWSALHGIAEITTPVSRIITRTDATPAVYIVRQHGALYPEEGSRGIEFPFRETVPGKVHLIRKDTWSANGFNSFESMTEAHNTVLNAAGELTQKVVLDLGCGNGELLRKAKIVAKEVHGIDNNVRVLEAATKVAFVRLLNIFDPSVFDRHYDVVFVSVQRLLEEENIKDFLARLKEHSDATVFYSYSANNPGWRYAPPVEQSTSHVINGAFSAALYRWRNESTNQDEKPISEDERADARSRMDLPNPPDAV